MCGIVGYAGSRDLSHEVLRGLSRLEYRGYDSAGLAILPPGGELKIVRSVGRVDTLRTKLNGTERVGAHGGLAVGHTRWATHGAPEERNAHPHTGSRNALALVHNGIIENYRELREELTHQGYTFSSDTDTEVIACLIESLYAGDLISAVRAALPKLRGSYALAVIHNGSEPKHIVAARSGSPLVIGLGQGEKFLASDVSAFVEHTPSALYLEEGDIAVLTSDTLQVFDRMGHEVRRQETQITWSAEAAQKGGFDHFMRKEIDEQPAAVRATLTGRVISNHGGLELRMAELNRLINAQKLPKRITIAACGTSYHAGVVAKYVIEALTRTPVEVDVASEFRYRDPILDPDMLLVVVSQSGETADTLAALRLAQARGAKVLAICNVVDSTIAREADAVLYTQAGPEIGVASTKAFTTQLVMFQLLALYLATQRQTLPRHALRRHLSELLDATPSIEEALQCEGQIRKLARTYHGARLFMFLGRGLYSAIALEGALKLKEIAYIPAEGYPAAEMKHGPIALIDERTVAVVLATRSPTYAKTLANIAELKSRGGTVIAIGTQGDTELPHYADHVIFTPDVPDALIPLVAVISLQLLAYHIAGELGLDPDKPRNLAKSVTVE